MLATDSLPTIAEVVNAVRPAPTVSVCPYVLLWLFAVIVSGAALTTREPVVELVWKLFPSGAYDALRLCGLPVWVGLVSAEMSVFVKVVELLLPEKLLNPFETAVPPSMLRVTLPVGGGPALKIGRASCRERV